MGYNADTPAAVVRDDPAAAAIIDRHVPGAFRSPYLGPLNRAPLGKVLRLPNLGVRVRDLGPELWNELAALPNSAPPPYEPPAPPAPSPGYEPADTARGSARWSVTAQPRQWDVTELTFTGPEHGNPFVDVELTLTWVHESGHQVEAGAFYDGSGRYLARFGAPLPGTWTFRSASNAASLDGISAQVTVGPPAGDEHGPVEVADRFHFAHRDGTRHLPVGTTVYALTHQPEALQDLTIDTLTSSGFTKVRLCVFPKRYLYNTDDPPSLPYEQSGDFSRFNPDFFRRLETRIAQLRRLGIQADVILFHPYDAWGYSEMPGWADELYVRYVVRRLAAFSNVWWSLANEYDLLLAKETADWERIAAEIQRNDHVGHHHRPWITHLSAQRVDVYRTTENVAQWRADYGKPVVVDECGYEGDLDQGWGNLTGPELTRRFWEAAMRGGYAGHGETYFNEQEQIFWSKGGKLTGEAPARIGFLSEIVRASPGGVLEPLPGDWDAPWAGTDDHILIYFGFMRPRFRELVLPLGRSWSIEVIDTWNMTVAAVPGAFSGSTRVSLPGRQYMALRLKALPQ
jgi:hypothetical protein